MKRKGCHCEMGPEGSAEQTREPMDKNRLVSADPAPGQDDCSALVERRWAARDDSGRVEDGGLTGSYGSLRPVEGDAGAAMRERYDGGRSRVVLVANFDLGADRANRFLDGDPVHVFRFTDGGAQAIVVSDDYAVRFGFDGDHV